MFLLVQVIWRNILKQTRGVRYPCDQCEYFVTTAGYLRKHIENKHEGVRYPCKQCDYVFTDASNLKKHIEINMKVSDIPVTSVNTLPLQQVIWGNTLKINMKVLDIPVNNVIMFLLVKVIWRNIFKIKLKYPCDKCMYAATVSSDLKHNKHNNIISAIVLPKVQIQYIHLSIYSFIIINIYFSVL